jgi:hypothetical protein
MAVCGDVTHSRPYFVSPAIPHPVPMPPCAFVLWQHVIRMLAGLHVHRIVVTGYDGKPLAVVSITDVLAALVQEPAGYFGTFFDD